MTKLTNFSTYNMQKILKFYSNTLLNDIENNDKNKGQKIILKKNNFIFNTAEKKKKFIGKIYTHLFSHIKTIKTYNNKD